MFILCCKENFYLKTTKEDSQKFIISKMTGQHFTGKYILTSHYDKYGRSCPMTGRYFDPGTSLIWLSPSWNFTPGAVGFGMPCITGSCVNLSLFIISTFSISGLFKVVKSYFKVFKKSRSLA